MIPDLIIYNYRTQTMDRDILIGYVVDLLAELETHKIDTSFINVIDGNNSYPDTYALVGRILEYWAKRHNPLPTLAIYQSFLILFRHLCRRKTGGYGFFLINETLLPPSDCQKILNDLIELAEGNENPSFFNAIIITGDLYKLEAPYGVALNTISEGGICLNANVHRKSIWHETAHLLGAQDHYDEKQTHLSRKCAAPHNCLMQWNALNGNRFCENSITEIKQFIVYSKASMFNKVQP